MRFVNRSLAGVNACGVGNASLIPTHGSRQPFLVSRHALASGLKSRPDASAFRLNQVKTAPPTLEAAVLQPTADAMLEESNKSAWRASMFALHIPNPKVASETHASAEIADPASRRSGSAGA